MSRRRVTELERESLREHTIGQQQLCTQKSDIVFSCKMSNWTGDKMKRLGVGSESRSLRSGGRNKSAGYQKN